jgi:hypothetical protein
VRECVRISAATLERRRRGGRVTRDKGASRLIRRRKCLFASTGRAT